MNETPSVAADPSGIRRGVMRHRGFLACLVLLGGFTVGFEVLALRSNIKFVPLALPLKAKLDTLDHQKLKPYQVVHATQIIPQILDTLGTKDYIQWTLKDTSVGSENDRPAFVNLFVTYYTGKRDQVPHVPEECYLGGGFSQVQADFIDIEIPAWGEGVTVPFQVLQFERQGMLGRESQVVLYTFHANGRFRASRLGVRTLLANPRDKYAYFSKLEVSFGIAKSNISKAQTIEAGKRFLQVVVPVLLEDHWPDWDAAVAAAEAPAEPPAKTETAGAEPAG